MEAQQAKWKGVKLGANTAAGHDMWPMLALWLLESKKGRGK